MSVTVDWMDARYFVIHANFTDNWDWDEWYEGLNRARHLMSNSQKSITLMLDLLGSHKLTATNSLLEVSDDFSAPANLERLIVICEDKGLGQRLVTVLQDLYPHIDDIVLTQSHDAAFENVRSTVETSSVS